jgi:hypothetical protein
VLVILFFLGKISGFYLMLFIRLSVEMS